MKPGNNVFQDSEFKVSDFSVENEEEDEQEHEDAADILRWMALKMTSLVAGDGRGTSPPASPNAAIASRIASRTEMASMNGGSPMALLP